MVAKVISGKNIQGALNYNEQKVLQGTAQCIMASGFMKEGHDMTFYEKLQRFIDLNARNTRSKTNTLHISLNFDVTEKLGTGKLNTIASTYMSKIGFGHQPYLVYEHKDAAHPHVHIVTTLIQEDGKRIPIHYLGQNKSEVARKEIEKLFNLVIAESKRKQQVQSVKKADLTKAVYGKSETKRTIANIVSEITQTYKYASLPELNAILRHYNVEASRGSEKSIMFQKMGLLYSLVDSTGKHIGIPIKASALSGKPTLPFLEKQFLINEAARLPLREQLKSTVEKMIQRSAVNSLPALIKELDKKNITAVPRINADGRCYGITFIDHRNRTVFNGSNLGKQYSASAIAGRLAEKPKKAEFPINPSPPRHSIYIESPEASSPSGKSENPLIQLITSEGYDPISPYAGIGMNQSQKKRRRKRKRL